MYTSELILVEIKKNCHALELVVQVSKPFIVVLFLWQKRSNL
jgi:hypothetical protein